ncbi:IPT/TIG domain-containing protein [Actinoplanes sp. NPDC051851]|uniref:IPT/TIG domain-containing protein n=1 Tax=Actinoplanes sp. NPDC051851 TaxID=3154753 RepID=UPI00342ACA02
MSRHRPRLAVVAALLVAAQFTVQPPASAAPVRPASSDVASASQAMRGPSITSVARPVDYTYDGAGQLRGVAEVAAGAGARYSYDDAGNVTRVERTAAGALSISGVTPGRASAGASVAIGGTGFAATPSGNTVTFNGTPATVTGAAANRLTVTVPAGATSGAITVSTGSVSADSPQSFTVTAAVPEPSIAGFSPASGAAGTTVTITGSGFSAVKDENNVAFGRTRARVTAATAGALTVTVPEAAVSGRIRVVTAGGTATSTGDFVAITNPFGAADIGPDAVLTVDGTPSTVTIGTGGTVAVLRFAGAEGQRVSLGVTGSTLGDVKLYAYTPYGGSIAHFEYDEPWAASDLAGGLALPPLPTSGTYQVVVQPSSATATGSFTATLSTRATGVLSLTGAGATVALDRAGKQAELTFTAGEDQRIGLDE